MTRLTFNAEEGDNDPTDEEYMDPDEEANEESSGTIAQYHNNEIDEEPKQNYTLKADYKLSLISSDESHKNGDLSNRSMQDHSNSNETSGNEESIDKKSSDNETSRLKSEATTISTSGSDDQITTTDTDECRDESPPKYAKIQPKSVKAKLPDPKEASEFQLVAAEKPIEEKATAMVDPGNSSDEVLDTRQDVESHSREKNIEMSRTDPKKEKLDAPTESAVISGPLLVTLALGSGWKRRYLSLVGENLYIWTSHK